MVPLVVAAQSVRVQIMQARELRSLRGVTTNSLQPSTTGCSMRALINNAEPGKWSASA
jgi:hypothetical protein